MCLNSAWVDARLQEPVEERVGNRSPQAWEKADWSHEIASILFGKQQSKILVRSEAELVSLLHQARENKAVARVIPWVEGDTERVQALLDKARAEADHRLQDALSLLSRTQKICTEMAVPYVVIKSLDALPDIGHDIDLLVGQNLPAVRAEVLRRFKCNPVTLTFCDRQAGKFSVFIDGFESDFELYTRISQLGEEYYPEERILERRSKVSFLEEGTFLCSAEDRLLIACIHTMYRHGKIRLSDLNIAYQLLKSQIDLSYVLETVEASGIQRGFAVFMRILERTVRESTDRDALTPPVRDYTERVLNSDALLKLLSGRLQLRFPLRIPLRIMALLFLYKSFADFGRTQGRKSWRSLVAPILLAIDKSVPLRIQKAIAVRIW